MSPGKLLEQASSLPYAPPSRDAPEPAEPSGPPAPTPEEIAEQAHREGFERGRQEALAQAEVERQQQLERLTASLAELDRLADRLVEECHEQLVSIGTTIAARILRESKDSLSGLAERCAKDVLEAARLQSNCVVRVHPDDFEIVDAARKKLDEEPLVTIKPDATLGRGDVQVDTNEQTIDASLAAACAQLVDALKVQS